MKSASATYISKEEASQRKPIEIYRLWSEAGREWTYTSGDTSVIFDGKTYQPATLSRTSVKYDVTLEVTSMSITASKVTTPMIEFIAINPVDRLWMQVSKLFRDQSPYEANVIFIGQIKAVSFKGSKVNIACVGFEQFLKMTIPTMRYQITCNHTLFDTACTKTKSSYKVTATITVNAAKTILTSATFGTYDDGYFVNGELIFNSQSVSIVAHTGDDITLLYPISTIVDTDSVDAYPGCDRRAETCRDKFNNIINFLGFPFIPVENPGIRARW
jgi:uncharacterized phage protein (TIGR02218 family)